MKRIKEIVNKNLTGRKLLFLFVITNIIYGIMLMVTIPKTMAFSKGMKLLDMMPMGYDSEYINALFGALGENGRGVYLYNQIPIDMVYPFLFGISYCLLLVYFLKKINKLNSAFFYLIFLPIIAGIADYLENLGIINMLSSYPNQSQLSMDVTNVFSIIKSMTTTVFFVALIITLAIFGYKTIVERITNAKK
tara:strand:+ start:196 stop:771 length:576 start_codon:yes stop_codon:yes gene_type:complete